MHAKKVLGEAHRQGHPQSRCANTAVAAILKDNAQHMERCTQNAVKLATSEQCAEAGELEL